MWRPLGRHTYFAWLATDAGAEEVASGVASGVAAGAVAGAAGCGSGWVSRDTHALVSEVDGGSRLAWARITTNYRSLKKGVAVYREVWSPRPVGWAGAAPPAPTISTLSSDDWKDARPLLWTSAHCYPTDSDLKLHGVLLTGLGFPDPPAQLNVLGQVHNDRPGGVVRNQIGLLA